MSDELQKAEILFELGRHAAARDLLGPLVAAEPDYGMAWAFLGYAWSQDGEPTRALEAARTALRVEPDNLFAWKIIVLAENQLRERADTEQAAAAHSDRALRAADRCVELDPMSADCHRLRAMVLRHRDRRAALAALFAALVMVAGVLGDDAEQSSPSRRTPVSPLPSYYRLPPSFVERLPTPLKPPPNGWPTENPRPPRPYLTPAPPTPGG